MHYQCGSTVGKLITRAVRRRIAIKDVCNDFWALIDLKDGIRIKIMFGYCTIPHSQAVVYSTQAHDD